MSVASDVIKRLREEHPELLADKKEEAPKNIDLSEDRELLPSELKAASDEIKRRRLTAPGLSDNELDGLMRRIGRK